MKNQELLLKSIQRKLEKSISLIDAIAGALNISYDAAHRRVSLKSKFSIDEAVQLCLHYNIAMDNLIRASNKIVVEKTSDINTSEDFVSYLKESHLHLKEFKKSKNPKLFYSAKDIPLFYTIGGSLLAKFKLYVWSNLIIEKNTTIPFKEFQLTHSMQEYAQELSNIYNSCEVHEIWNDTTINSTIQQIYYFFESGLLDNETAITLLNDTKEILYTIEKKSINKESKFNLYHNELLILNNNVIVEAEEKIKLFIPYTILGYLITTEQNTVNKTHSFFKHQIKNSKHLNAAGLRDLKLFFNRAHQKINWYQAKIENFVSESNL